MISIAASNPEDRPRVLVLALNGLEMDRRVENEARSLSAAGFGIYRVGMRVFADQPERESTGFDTIIRMNPSWHDPQPARSDAARNAMPTKPNQVERPLVRQWRWKLWLMSKIRESRTKRSWDRIRQWYLWNDAYVEVCRELKPRAIIACDLDTLRAGAILKRELGCILVYDAHEMWTEMAFVDYMTRPFKRFMRMLEGRYMRQSDLTTTVSKRFSRIMADRYRTKPPTVVYSGTLDRVDHAEPAASPLRLYFQGSFSRDRGMRDILESLVPLAARVTFTLQGFGPLESELRALAVELGLGEVVHFLGPVPPEDVVDAAREYDVGIVAGTPESINARLTTPNRPFVYIGAGLAVVTSDALEEVAEMVNECECGVVVSGDGPQPITSALDELLGSPATVERMKCKSVAASERYLWDRQFGPVVDFVRESIS